MITAINRFVFLSLCFGAAFLLAPAAMAQPAAGLRPATNATENSAGGTTFSMDSYVLGPNDRVKLSVYGEEALSGEYVISSDGRISLPLIGNVSAGGETVKQLQDQLVSTYLNGGYLKDPKITAEVVSARPFFILGEVKIPGQYPCLNGMTVMNAVATAGGFTYRANMGDVYIRHSGAAQEQKQKLTDTTAVFPGDTIRIEERWF